MWLIIKIIENANIVLRNGIDKTYTKQIGMKLDSYATQLAVKLKKYAFWIQDVKNAPQPSTWTIAYILWTGKTTATIERLKTFLPIDQVIDMTQSGTWTAFSDALYQQQLSGVDLVLDIGNSYLTKLQTKIFDYYR